MLINFFKNIRIYNNLNYKNKISPNKNYYILISKFNFLIFLSYLYLKNNFNFLFKYNFIFYIFYFNFLFKKLILLNKFNYFYLLKFQKNIKLLKNFNFFFLKKFKNKINTFFLKKINKLVKTVKINIFFKNLFKYNFIFLFFLINLKKKSYIFFSTFKFNKIKNQEITLFNFNKKFLLNLKTIFKNFKNFKNNFFNFFILYNLEYIFNNKFFLKILNNNNFFFNNFFQIYYIKIQKYKRYITKNFNLNFELMCLVLNHTLYHKDILIFVNWITKNMEKINLRKHRKFLLLIKDIFKENENFILNILSLKGLFFDIRGKVGVAGNSKKRHFYFYIGKINVSTKNIKIDYQQSVIKTFTGCLGLTVITSY